MTAKKSAATNLRSFRTFLLMQQFAASEIGARISQARREAGGMTQEQLADLLNVSKRSIQDYEAGQTIPWKHFKQMEAIFSRPMEWFLHGDAEESPAHHDPSEEEVMARLERIEQVLAELVVRLAQDESEHQDATNDGQQAAL